MGATATGGDSAGAGATGVAALGGFAGAGGVAAVVVVEAGAADVDLAALGVLAGVALAVDAEPGDFKGESDPPPALPPPPPPPPPPAAPPGELEAPAEISLGEGTEADGLGLAPEKE